MKPSLVVVVCLIAVCFGVVGVEASPSRGDSGLFDSLNQVFNRFKRAILPELSDIRKKRNLPTTYDIRK
ncbi:unnamed protein product [Caenorhabditis auriculariae]|uniref:Uncharacterized protein n=1 Tax=Caenorhabditis auriculariae TaxID=2777116 RepID=A0A8S1HJ50_9PELO|nr:unnamed protein product [Caenorhabditis auriculariae]